MRGRGGFFTKVRLACAVAGAAGSRSSRRRASATRRRNWGALLDGVRVARPAGSPGRPRKRPDRLIADRGYAHDSCRALLRRQGIPHTISERGDQQERRAKRGGASPTSTPLPTSGGVTTWWRGA